MKKFNLDRTFTLCGGCIDYQNFLDKFKDIELPCYRENDNSVVLAGNLKDLESMCAFDEEAPDFSYFYYGM